MLFSLNTQYNHCLCFIFQKEAFAVPPLRVQQASPAETSRRTISSPFFQINMYYFQRCVSCYRQSFSSSLSYRFNMVLHPCSYPPGFPHQDVESHFTEILWLPFSQRPSKDKQVEGQFAQRGRFYIAQCNTQQSYYILWPIMRTLHYIIDHLNIHHPQW